MLSKETVLSIKSRKARQKQQLRDQILAAARQLFVTDGYHGLSMRRLAEKIEYSPTAIYLHFRDKDDLVLSLCEETFGRLVRELESVPPQRDPIAQLKLGLRRYIDFGLKNPQHYLVTFVLPDAHRHDPSAAADTTAGMRALGILRAEIERCIAAKKLRRVDVDTATRVLWSAIHGVTSLLIVFPNFPWGDRETMIGMAIDGAVEGLRPRR
jgi:AcrR family transcriptional regulator